MELEVVRSDREIEIFVGVEDEIFEDDVDDECKYDNWFDGFCHEYV